MALMRGISRGYVAIALFGLALLAPATASAAPGSISGTVTAAADGAPLSAIEVCAWEVGEEEAEVATCDPTDGVGEYTLAGLEPGDYKVEFWDESRTYLGEYYDGVEFWSEAEILTVGDGAVVTGIDAELDKPAQVSGVVKATGSGSPIEEVEVCIWGTEFFNCDETGADGKYSFDFVWPGEYEVEFWPWSETNYVPQWWDHRDRWYDADLLELKAAQVETEIDADLVLGGQIKGTVVSAASGAPLEEIRVCSIVLPTEQLYTCTWTNGAGQYTLRRLVTGTYKVVFSPELSEWFPEEESEEDGYRTQFWNNQPTLSAANPVNVVASAAVGGVNASLVSTMIVPPVPPAPPATKKPVVKKKCPKGKKLKKVKGKKKCVKVRKKGKRAKGKRAGTARGSALELPGRVRLRS